MTEQRRTASPLVFLAFGLGLLGLVLCVVPWTQASSRNEFVGQGSTSISQQSLEATPHASTPVAPSAPGRGALAKDGGAPDPKKPGNPFESFRSGGDTQDWTRMRAFAQHKFFLVVGSVDGLYPGRQADLPVTFVNGQAFDLLVDSATIAATGTAACDASNLQLSTITFPAPFLVPARDASDQTLPFSLRASAPDSCQGATFTVTVTSKATAA